MADLTLPSDFIKQMSDILGEEELQQLLQALQTDRVTSIRTNGHKTKGIPNFKQVPWHNHGFYLENRPLFTMDPLFHAGAYYAQEASSMFVATALRQYWDDLGTDQPMVLDLCAAPGGKSTLLASLLDGQGWLISNEVVKSRASILVENLTKWGAPNVTITSNDPKDFGELNSLFDVILIDAPCSGEGMFRKDDKAIEDWSLGNVQLCSERQRRIVADVYPSLKEGGLLIYSTCTYNTAEDEENVEWIANELGAEILKVNIQPEWQITETEGGYHFYPHKTQGEGFFLSILRKTESESRTKIKGPKQIPFAPKPVATQCQEWLTEEYKFVLQGDLVIAYPKEWMETQLFINQKLRVLQSGLPIGNLKGKDIIPHEALALSWSLDKNQFVNYDASWEEAIQFLKRENLQLDNVEKGIVLFTFHQTPMGWGKNLGNRCNNLYPSEWRIRMNADAEKYTNILE